MLEGSEKYKEVNNVKKCMKKAKDLKDSEALMSKSFASGHQWNFIFRDFPLCCEYFKFNSHLIQTLFRSLHVMAVSFQMLVAPYCVLM